MIRFLRKHGDLLMGAVGLIIAVFLACALGPTLDNNTTLANDGGKTAYASR